MTQRPSAHENEWARYTAQYGNGAANAPTGLVLSGAAAAKRWVDDFGVEQAPSPTITYAPTADGEDTALHVMETTVDDYTNTVSFSDRLCGPKYWQTACPGGFTVSWEVPGVFPPGSAIQMSDAYIERIGDADALFTNPTQMGCGRMPEDYSDPGVYLKQLTAEILHFDVGARIFTGCVHPLEFMGGGVGDTFGDGSSQWHGGDNNHPIVLAGQRIAPRIELNFGGRSCVHRLDYAAYHPTAWDQRGKSGPLVAFGLGALSCLRGRFFDTATVFDLALGPSDEGVEQVDFAAPPATRWFHEWLFTTELQLTFHTVPSAPLDFLAQDRSPYLGIVLRNDANDFCIALVVKLRHANTDRNVMTCAKVESFNLAQVIQFINEDEDGTDLDQATNVSLGLQAKCDGIRPAGWCRGHFFLLTGLTDDVVEQMHDLYSSGDMDLPEIDDLPTPVTDGTIWPPGSAEPSALAEAPIVLVTGDSQAGVGQGIQLQADLNAELGKFSKDNPVNVSRPKRTTDSRKLWWNDDLERFEMLQHDRGGWGYSAPTTFGLETSLVHGLLRRQGITETFIIKCAAAGAAFGQGTVFNWEADESELQTIIVSATITPSGTGATITAAPGTFDGVVANTGIEISGSLFVVGSFSEPNYLAQTGIQFSTLSPRRTGNNTYRNRPLQVLTVSEDGSEITVNNSTGGGLTYEFHSETRTFTFRHGTFSLRRMTQDTVERAKTALRMEMRLTPRLLMTADHSGDNDTATDQETFTQQVKDHASFLRGLFDVDETSPTCPPHAIVKTNPKIFLGTDEGLAGVIAGQEAAAEQIQNAFTVETADLPIRFEGNGDEDNSPWPPVDRHDNGVHLTSSALIAIGFRIDNGLDQFSFFPQTVVTAEQEVNAAGDDYFEVQEEIVTELIVEDGTGIADANSYAGVEEVDDYFLATGGNATWDDAELATKENALRAATQWIDATYGLRFVGFKKLSTQALECPRSLAFLASGALLAGVPIQLKKATGEMARRWITNAADLLPDVAAGSNVETSTVDVGGVRIGKTFQGSKTTSKSFPIVDRFLRQAGLLSSGNFVSA